MNKDYLPLKGIRVLDLSHTVSGPFSTLIMADLGAEVIKIEPPDGDEARKFAPIVNGLSSYFASFNRGKKSVILDLKNNDDRNLLYNLVKESNIVVENYRPGVREKLGVDPETLFKINKDLIYISIKGFRPNSQYNDKPAYDLIIQAMSGLMLTTGVEGDPPIRVSFALFDIITGLFAALYAISGLYSKIRPFYTEVYLYDSALFSMSYIPLMYLIAGEKPKRLGSAHPGIVPYQAFMDSNGRWFIVAVSNDRQWEKLCDVIGLNSLANDQRFKTNEDRVKNREQLVSILQEIFRRNSRDYWLSLFDNAKIPSSPVYDIDDVFNDPYAEHILFELNQNFGKIKQLKEPVTINGKEPVSDKSVPLLGENTQEIRQKFIKI
ncbi:MAG: CaiB/BaiF CoA transferase family protein [Caldisphaera sp.]|uniref:CaiB/BaiF CoA transferase family protein n=1 Tax=Caldisphaera sp. TaxID=2060322 RepID=UPI003D0D0309